MAQNRITYVCTQCGSEDIQWDATARWSVQDQRFELSATHDQAYCEQCGEECDTKEVYLLAACVTLRG